MFDSFKVLMWECNKIFYHTHYYRNLWLSLCTVVSKYCKTRNFHGKFIFAISTSRSFSPKFLAWKLFFFYIHIPPRTTKTWIIIPLYIYYTFNSPTLIAVNISCFTVYYMYFVFNWFWLGKKISKSYVHVHYRSMQKTVTINIQSYHVLHVLPSINWIQL